MSQAKCAQKLTVPSVLGMGSLHPNLFLSKIQHDFRNQKKKYPKYIANDLKEKKTKLNLLLPC